MADVLGEIIQAKREHIAHQRAVMSVEELGRQAGAQEAPRGFYRALADARAAGVWGLIAEIKRSSPSKGLIRKDFDASALARAYEAGGASCLSVLTDGPYFQGDDSDLTAARAACALPVLRKDFIVDPYQVAESRAIGADCLLLIMAALSDAQASELAAAAADYGLDVLVEVHDRAELDRALALPTPLIGINNRDLKSLTVSLETAVTLGRDVPPDRLTVAESGLHKHGDLAHLAGHGMTTFLIGESLMRHEDVTKATRAILGHTGAATQDEAAV